ncbi:MAG: tetratricopeptide repeat protein [Ferruginibacter sp.]|nr:tetratricopeptide repeat protein [Ferruginibacter sp.]
MKSFSLLIVLAMISALLFSQNRQVDSLRTVLENEKADTGRIIAMYQLSRAYQASKPDSALLLAQDAYYLAKNKRFIKGESWALNQMALAFTSIGNFPRALEYYIQQLKIEEKRDYPDNIASVYLNIALLYNTAREYDKAIVYAKRADSIINTNGFEELSLYSLLNIGEIFEKNDVLDSALIYTKKCYAKSTLAGNDIITGTALNNLGNIYFKSGNLLEAFKSYKVALPYLEASGDYNNYAECMLGLARIFQHNTRYDSAIYYGKKSFAISSGNQFLVKALDASIFLSKVYKTQKNTDSAFAYQEIMIGIQDSIDSRQKIKEVQNLTTEEEVRQKEIAQQKKEELKERKQKLQLLLIGIAIPIFFLGSVFISRKKVHKRIIEFSGIISILLFFEYITLLLHPFIAEKSNHSPFIEIIVFVAIAAIITPSHHRIQHWLINKLTELNYLKHHKPAPKQEEKINADEVES